MTEQEWLTTEDPMEIYRLIEMHWNNKRIITYVGDQGKYSLEVSVRQILLWLAACIDLSKYDYPKTQREETSLKLYRTGGDSSRSRADCISCLRLWCDSSQNKEGGPPIKLRTHLLRDVIGNPWQPVALTRPCDDCNGAGYWPRYERSCGSCDGSGKVEDRKRCPYLTPQVLSLAQAAWDDRPDNRPLLDTFRLLMLADVLEEAGCTESALLDHLRGADHVKVCPYCIDQLPDWETNTIECRHCEGSGILSDDDAENCHIRGCWALDLILGKE